ncbi:hypothetical protein KIW84_040594 [Lathyrus oleraceus]|uniref:Uncharacterized protein n=1 Tax=Pisum sativum TaxID=3888 RepID=A0A9D5APZ8_PEA|nr:hypothetical protein KIW84_040594 [Pisum sativum]
MSNELKYKEQAFDEKIEKIFNLAEKVDSESISVGNAAVGSLLGGIGYFYGQSKIALSRTLNFRKHVDYVSYWPAELYTAVPSRSFFPRGFLWDEGFHQFLIWRWDIHISLDIIGHWLDMMNIDGWIPRRQIREIEASFKAANLIYVITKLGLLFVYDLETATAVYRNRISPDPIFLTPEATSVGGFYAINRRGQVLLATVNEQTIVNFVSGQLNNLELVVSLAKRGNLPGAEKLVVERFHELFAQTKYKEAAELASQSPQGILRTPDTVAKFQSVPVQAGQTPPLLQYFGTLLTRGKPNAFESLELSRLVVNQNKKNLLENWLAEDKLECSEELGDLVKTVDNDLALKIYIKARANSNGFTSKQEHEQRLLQQHCRTNTRPNANLTRPVKLSLSGIEAGPQIILQCKDSPTKL